MTRYPNPACALHQLDRHSSGTPAGAQSWPEPLGSDAFLRAASAYLMAARIRDEREELLARTWRSRLTLRLNAAARSVRRSWEYWNSSTQRQVRELAGFWELIALMAAAVAFWLGAMAAILPH